MVAEELIKDAVRDITDGVCNERQKTKGHG